MAYLGNAPVVGDSTNSFKLLDDIASFTLTFDATDTSVVSISGDTLSFTNHRFVTGQKVTYTDGGGTAIGGLTDGTSYFIIKIDQNTIKLATNASNAASSTAIDLTSGAAGGSHTLNVKFDGVNTKFKATFNNGKKAKISRAAQISLSINGVIQQPQDSSSPSVGYGVEADSTIVFSTAPAATDKVFASFIGEVAASFDITDNTIDNFTGDGSTTLFNLSKEVPSSQDVLVTLDGVTQHPSDASTTRSYSVINQALTFVSAPDTGVAIQARHIGFAGATSSEVTGFYGRTGNVALKSTDDVSVQNISGVGATFTSNVNIEGVLTYEDVTNVDSIGIITARAGVLVGSGITLSKDGDIFATGVTTSTTFVGALTGNVTGNLTGDVTGDVTGTASQVTIASGADNRVLTAASANTIQGESNVNINGGILIAGHTASTTTSNGEGPFLQVKGTDSRGGASFMRHSADAAGCGLYIGKSRNATIGSNTVVQSGDELGRITFSGDDGTDVHTVGVEIQAHVDGTPGSNDMPGRLTFLTTADGAASPTERLRIDKGGVKVIKNGNLNISSTYIDFSGSISTPSTAAAIYRPADNTLAFSTANEERLRILNGGGILKGHSTASTNFHDPQTTTDRTPSVQIHGGNSVHASAALVSWSSNAGAYYSNALYLAHSGSSTIGTNGIVSNSNTLGSIVFSGDDGDEFVKGAMISARVDGTPGADDMPARLSFFTTPENSDTPTEKVRITQDGKVSIGNPASGSPNRLLYVDTGTTGDGMRITSDEVLGDLVINNTGDGHGRSFVINASRTDNGTLPKLHLAGQGSITFAVDANSTRMTIDSNGNIGAPSGNNIYNASDERLKENMIDLTNGLDKINKLKPVSFTWKNGWSESLDGVTQYGFGAQTTQSVDELLVEPFSTGDVELNGETIENPLRVNEKHIIPLLVKAIQELSAKVAALEG